MFSDRLKELRLEKGLTQKQLAEKAYISEISIRKYENGERKPKIEVLETFTKIFDVQIDYLLGKSNYKNFEEKLQNKNGFSEIVIELTDEKNSKKFAKRLTYGELALVLADIKLDWK